MQTHQWDRLKRALQPAFRANLPDAEFARRVSATQGEHLTDSQFEWLSNLGTDVILVGSRQYAIGATRAGMKLFRLVRPLPVLVSTA